MSLRSVQQALMDAGIFPEKKYSQHFLVDEKIVKELVDSLSLRKSDSVLEIGSGTGEITQELALKEVHVIGIELHEALVFFLKKKFSSMKNVAIVGEDFLQVDLDKISFTKVVGAPPYAISDDIMYKLFRHGFEEGTFIWQCEFAEKMIAIPGTGEYHPLSILSQYEYEGKIIRKVSPKAFYPIPNHFSAILVLKKKKDVLQIQDYEAFILFIRTLFRFRNKTMERVTRQIEKHPVRGITRDSFGQAVSALKIEKTKIFQAEPNVFVELFLRAYQAEK